jgi:hypothetical protein
VAIHVYRRPRMLIAWPIQSVRLLVGAWSSVICISAPRYAATCRVPSFIIRLKAQRIQPAYQLS